KEGEQLTEEAFARRLRLEGIRFTGEGNACLDFGHDLYRGDRLYEGGLVVVEASADGHFRRAYWVTRPDAEVPRLTRNCAAGGRSAGPNRTLPGCRSSRGTYRTAAAAAEPAVWRKGGRMEYVLKGALLAGGLAVFFVLLRAGAHRPAKRDPATGELVLQN